MKSNDGLELTLNSLMHNSEVLNFYGGAEKLHYNDELHVYFRANPDGTHELIPGVTTITGMVDKSGPLTQWAANEAVLALGTTMCESDPVATGHLQQTYDLLKDKQELPNNHPWTLVSVTTRELAELMNEARFAHRRISKKATVIGKDAHSWLEGLLRHSAETSAGEITQSIAAQYALDNPLPEDVNSQRCCEAAIEWLVKHKFRPLLCEHKVYSKEHCYCGTVDWVASIEGCDDPTCCVRTGRHMVLGDFKTSKSLHDEYRMQVAAYLFALIAPQPEFEEIEALLLLRLGKDDGSFEVMLVPREEAEDDFNGFLGALTTYNWFAQLDLAKRGRKKELKALKPKGKKKPVVIPDSLKKGVLV